jgi:beta-mannosidase
MKHRPIARRDFLKTTALGVPLLAAGCLRPGRNQADVLAGKTAADVLSSSAVRSLFLDQDWQFHEAAAPGAAHPAEVPGCVHTDLLRNQLIPDPFYGTNEQKLQWIGEKDWVYETTFPVPAKFLSEENVELVFAGLDTYATVTLNGTCLLTANNMFRSWRVNAKHLLKPTGNILQIRFRNVFDENLPKYQTAPFRLQAFGNNDQAEVKVALYSRKAQFHYGWDWGPRFITAGIWRPVKIEAWSQARLRHVFVRCENVSPTGADIVSLMEVESDREQTAMLSVRLGSTSLATGQHALVKGLNRITLQGHVDQPQLWWTNGLGAQPLYEHRTQLTLRGKTLDEHLTRVGIRSLEVVREPDADGRSFYVRLNGVPVFMKGASYVPQDNFQSRVTRERYVHIIRSAAEANMNMLRVWGGGLWENDVFYDLCDQYGILVWQDLQFACAMYPADEAFLENVRQEILD